ncbi:MAG: hypothetical protein V4732_22005 [Pseudomonadota bacterium]
MKKIFYNVGRVFTLAFITTMLAMAPSAQAGWWRFVDGLAPSSIDNWSCWASEYDGEYNTCEYYPGLYIRNEGSSLYVGDSYWLFGVSGWSDVGRPVSIAPFYYPVSNRPAMSCRATIYGVPYNRFSVDTQLEVIDSASWTYITTARKKFLPRNPVPSTESVINTPYWRPYTKEIFVRLGIIGGGEYASFSLDELIVTCTY